jgi:hypothetical protein
LRRPKPVLVLVALLACVSCSNEVAVQAQRVIATPEPTGRASVSVELPKPKTASVKRPAPIDPPVARAAPARVVAADVVSVPVVGLAAFTGLGAWVDVFDYKDDPASIVPLVKGMAAEGTRTLFLETSRYQSPTDIQFPRALGAALDEAKAHAMRVVAWYPPAFDDVNRDVRRSLAAVNFRSPQGHRFDAFGADIEYTTGVPDHTERSKRAVVYSERLRAGAGGMTLAAIVIAPTSLEIRPDRWPDFPWQALRASYEIFMPMNYWTARSADAKTAADLTTQNVQKTKQLTNRPVNIIGGLAEQTDEAQAAAYVHAARQAGSLGGGLYDYRTTRKEVWDELRKLNA